jgi:hypothetical protein
MEKLNTALRDIAGQLDEVKRALEKLDHALTIVEAQNDAMRVGHSPLRNGHIRPPYR